MATSSPILLVMGVSGSGKSTVGSLLAGRLGWTYADADGFHPRANIAKMRAGQPLTDEDRLPWLRELADWMGRQTQPAVVSCSALKRAYRDLLRAARPDLSLVYLDGSAELIGRRMRARHGHFFPQGLLDSQFAALEPPGPDEHPLTVGIDGPAADTVSAIIAHLPKEIRAAPHS